MSLINQMLRDLEQRNNGQVAAPPALDMPPAQPQNASRRYWPWLLVGMLGSVYYAWNSRQSRPLPPLAPVETVQQETVAQQPLPVPTLSAQVAPLPEISEPLPTATAMPVPTMLPVVPATAAIRSKPTAKAKLASVPRPTQTPRHNAASQRQVQALLQQAQGNVSLMMRKETLKEALQLDPDNLTVRDLLLQTLLKSGSGAEVDGFLQDSLRLFPTHLVFITSLAQLQMQRKDFAAATATLERVDSSEPAYLSLLAAGYQQQKRFHNAAEVYQRLTQMQPDKAENWLGLAISAENLHQRQIAVQAYRQALEKNTLNGEVVDYIKQRLSVLN